MDNTSRIIVALFLLMMVPVTFGLTGKTTIGKHLDSLRFLNKKKKPDLFEDW